MEAARLALALGLARSVVAVRTIVLVVVLAVFGARKGDGVVKACGCSERGGAGIVVVVVIVVKLVVVVIIKRLVVGVGLESRISAMGAGGC